MDVLATRVAGDHLVKAGVGCAESFDRRSDPRAKASRNGRRFRFAGTLRCRPARTSPSHGVGRAETQPALIGPKKAKRRRWLDRFVADNMLATKPETVTLPLTRRSPRAP